MNAVSRVLVWVHQTVYTWVAVFDENTRFFWSRYVVLLESREDSRVLGIVAVWSTAGGHLLNTCIFVVSFFTLPCLSQRFWSDTEED